MHNCIIQGHEQQLNKGISINVLPRQEANEILPYLNENTVYDGVFASYWTVHNRYQFEYHSQPQNCLPGSI